MIRAKLCLRQHPLNNNSYTTATKSAKLKGTNREGSRDATVYIVTLTDNEIIELEALIQKVEKEIKSKLFVHALLQLQFDLKRLLYPVIGIIANILRA